MESEKELFTKRSFTSLLGGQLYEIQLIMFFLEEATRRKQLKQIESFSLATNVEGCGHFDDLVFKYQCTDPDGRGRTKTMFIQVIHRSDKTRKITLNSLLSQNLKSAFSLKKYMQSYIKIKEQFFQKFDDPIFKGSIDDCEFVIFTNASLDLKEGQSLKKEIESDHILNEAGNTNYYYKVLATEEVEKVLNISADYEGLTNEVVKMILFESLDINNSLVQKYYECLTERVLERINKKECIIRKSFVEDEQLEFRNDIFKELRTHDKFSKLSYDEMKIRLLKTYIRYRLPTKKSLNLSLPQKNLPEHEIREFLDKLKLFIDQPNENEFPEIIKNKIHTVYQLERPEIDRIFLDVLHKVQKWWKYDDTFLTETNSFYQESLKVSFYFDVRLPTDLFTGREKELAQLHSSLQRDTEKVTVTSHMTVISGLGGIGKTELARQYINKYSNYYDNNIIWITSDNNDTINSSFLRLAKDKLSIPTKNTNGEDKSIESIVDQVYTFFSNRKSLFVFDNVEDCTNFVKYLPFRSLKSSDTKPIVLITSRNREWGKGIPVVDLNVLTEEEAIDYVKKRLEIYGDVKEEDIRLLVNKLQLFPLALCQATAYITEECILGEYTIADYLKDFKNKEKMLLDSPISFGNTDNYTKSVYNTWNNTINKISKETHGHTALRLLKIMAFMPKDKIRRDIFLGLSDMTEEQLKLSIRLLIKYCLINGEHQQTILNIHRLVQEVIKLQVIEQNQEDEVVKECLALVPSVRNKSLGDTSDIISECDSGVGTIKSNSSTYSVPMPGSTVVCIECYSSKEEGHISIKEGDTIEVTGAIDDGYLEGKVTSRGDRTGLFPANCVQEVRLRDPRPPSSSSSSIQVLRRKESTSKHIVTAPRTKKTYSYLPSEPRTVVLHTGIKGLGFIVRGATSPPMMNLIPSEKCPSLRYLDYVDPRGVAYMAGLREGDFLLKINDEDVSSASHEQVYTLIEKSGDLIQMTVVSMTMSESTILPGVGGDEISFSREYTLWKEVEMRGGTLKAIRTLMKLGNIEGKHRNYEKKLNFYEKALNIQMMSNVCNNDQTFIIFVNLLVGYYIILDKDNEKLPMLISNIFDLFDLSGEKKNFDSKTIVDLTEDIIHFIYNSICYRTDIEPKIKYYYYKINSHYQAEEIILNLDNFIDDPFEFGTGKKLFTKFLNILEKYGIQSHSTKPKETTTICLSCGSFKKINQETLKSTSDILGNIDCFTDLCELPKQIEVLERGLKILEERYGRDHINIVPILLKLGTIFGNLEEPRKQILVQEKAFHIQYKHYDRYDPELAKTLIMLSTGYEKLGEYNIQLENLEIAFRIYKKHYGHVHFNLIVVLEHLSKAYAKIGEYEKEQKCLAQMLAIQKNNYSEDHAELVQTK